MKILVCGYGNPFRTDDGVGHILAGEIAGWLQEAGEEAELRLEHQLLPELAADFSGFDLLVFADARIQGTAEEVGFLLEELSPDPILEGLNMHTVGPEWVLALAAQLGERVPPAVLASVEGDSFDFGDELTPACALRKEAALAAFREWFVRKHC